MKKVIIASVIIFILLLAGILIYSSIGTTYKGRLPCADCPGIDTTLTLYINNTYSEKNIYEGRNSSYEEVGRWNKIKSSTKDPQSSYLELLPPGKGGKRYYRLQNDKLLPLDGNLGSINSPFDMSLTKIK